MLSKKEAEKIKLQLIQQIESTFPEDKKNQAISQLQEMNENQLEDFLIKNNLMKQEKTPENQPKIFREIIKGNLSSYKIEENKDAIAVLEINPISKGHIIILPKKEISSLEKMPQSIFSLAKKLSKKIKSKLKPKEVGIASSKVLDEFIINVFPIYENESITSQRYSASEKELQEIQKKLEKKPRKKTNKTKKKNNKKDSKKYEKIRLPKRIP